MKLSKNGIKVLTAQYRSVLKKCLLINMGLFITFSANATEFSSNNSYVLTSPESLNFSVLENVTISNSSLTDTNLNFTFKDSKNIKVENSDLETSKGNVELTNTSFSYTCIDCYKENKDDPEESYSKYILGNDVKINNSEVTLGEKGKTNDFARISANNKLDINGSTVTMLGSSALVYEGTDADNGTGAVNISDSNITLNDKAALWVGEPGWWLGQENSNEATAPLTISNSNITLNNDSSINFAGNGADTIIKDGSKIIMNDNSSMKLNDLELQESKIVMKGASELNVTDVKLKDSSILGIGNKVFFYGKVDFSGFFDPATADVEGDLTRDGYDDEITYNLNNGTLKYANDKHLYDSSMHTHEAGATGRDENNDNKFADGKYALNTLNLNGGILDIANGKATDIKLAKLSLSKESNIILDTDLANQTMDRFSDDTTVDGSAKLNISKLNLVSDAQNEKTTINFTKDATLLAATNYTGATSNLKALSPIYSYDVAYDNTSGDFTFTRGSGSSTDDYNPAVYASSVAGYTIDFLQYNIANTAFSAMTSNKDTVKGNMPKTDNIWVSVIGFDDNVDFNHFQTVDSKMMSVIGGVNSDKTSTKFGDAVYGVYAGYMNGEQKYDGNKIDQNGGYIGLSAKVQNQNTFVQAVVNGGFIKNEDKHSFGNDKFDSYWTGVALKGGYDYKLNESTTVQPNIYVGYTFVNNEDYTSKSGARIKNDNLHLWEIAPGVKVSKDFANGWNGFAQAKYAFVMDNGGDVNVDNLTLPNISAKNYVEYGVGVEKALSDSWNLSTFINRRNGGREGWNGNINFKYNF